MPGETPRFALRSKAPVAALLRAGATLLRNAGIEGAALESRLLLAHALRVTPAALLRDQEARIDPGDFAALVARRAGREPLALILRRREFWSLELEVSGATLIPRPESETLIDAALAAWPERGAVRRVLDLGTGTGALLLAALSEFPDAFGVGLDRSEAAARLAARNAERLGLAARAVWLVGDWGAPLGGRFDLVLCNPPYIPSAEIARLMPEVARFEPKSALDGGPDGLNEFRQLLPLVPALLAPAGRAIVEIGAGQSGAACGLAEAAGLAVRALRPDLLGIPRALVLADG